LHDLGVHFALDDFGTGYSSLTYLKNLPVYLIKIDQNFIRDVIAEGVETVAHGAALLKLDCELAQGYGIAQPMPADNILEWVANWKTDDSW
tara:strand:- start:504 stop:776 length:273 start_codon:yes stop_codon:yes gene_type:complete